MAKKRPALRDDALVVRFNLAEVALFRKSLRRWHKLTGQWGLSFAGENDLTEAEIAYNFPFPSDYMCVTTMGRLRGAGFEPVRQGKWPHLSLRFRDRPTEEELKRLTELFDEPIENPHPS